MKINRYILGKLDLSEIISDSGIKQISNDLKIPAEKVKKVLSSPLLYKDTPVKVVDKVIEMEIKCTGAWINSKERDFIINYKKQTI